MQSLTSVVLPATQPAPAKAAQVTTIATTAKVAANATNTRATNTKATWSETAADLSLGLIVAAFDTVKLSAEKAVTAVKETAVAVATTVTTRAIDAMEIVNVGLDAVGASLTDGGISRNQLQSAMIVGSQPSLIVATPDNAEPAAPSAPAPSQPQAPVTELPDTQDVVSGNGDVYYVDFATGNDANSGKSTSLPWKRAPGDTAATANAASVVLKGGDTVRFKGGVAYRGTIVFKQSGDAANPIIYTGTGFGTGKAIWDGADAALSSVPCSSAAACGGASNWQSLRLVTYTEPTIANRKLYDATGPLYESQAPAVSDPFWDDDLTQFVTIPLSQATDLAAGRLTNAQLAAAAAGQTNARVAIWIVGNTVAERKITSVSGNTIHFDATGITPYTDRDGKAAVVGSVKSVTKPGLYAVIGAGKAIVYPRSGGDNQYLVGTGRYAFDLRGKSNITVHGFNFVRGTGSPKTTREGVGIANYGGAVSNIRIENNNFDGYSMQNGYGMVMLNNVTGLVIRNNRLNNLEGASGFRFGTAVSNLTVENNVMRKLGRTGIFLGGVKTGRVSGNILSEFSGIHGNGMSFYDGNADIAVTGNCVFRTVRPMTFSGGGSGGAVNNLRFTGNIFATTADGTSAVYSWGEYTRRVVLDNNVALGTRAGFILHASDLDVSVTRNRTSGLLINRSSTTPAGWALENNDNTAPFSEVDAANLTINSCSARGTQGMIVIGTD